ncbi:TadE/TadG family type IV pilus assembly protein [Methylobacterium sp. SyP6R]|uniref:TadE/TadG family type IV pilus assembly protein n=1 Tax=Methylobacterium sp. SyP6R TaxID=2718876 RepID=UPI001F315400|nr:TadE/TadG family type IV pilus assembly protein [Methylobacterium sp. SyP6R]MCF4126854.1 pilus assembly protein [Methylobacterium sp. SyP6R]
MLGLLRDDKGSTTVEFALVGLMFIMALLFTMGVAQTLYYNQKLDFAVEKAARDIIVGNSQKSNPPPTLAAFTQTLCAILPSSISCDDLIVNLYVVNGSYYSYVNSDQSGLSIPNLTPGSGQFTLGTQGQYQYLQVIYPVTFLPSFVTNLIASQATYKGQPAYLMISTAAFRVEQY